MTFSLLFTRMNGAVALLKAWVSASGEIQYWSSATLTGAHVDLDPGDKWLAVVAIHVEARRLTAARVAT